jgi:hypothetical protein
MDTWARLTDDGTVVEVRRLFEDPVDIPHKGVRWRRVVEPPEPDNQFYDLAHYALQGDIVTRVPVGKEVETIRRELIQRVKQIAAARIEAVMPDYVQRNMMALAIENIRAHGSNSNSWPQDMKAIAADGDAKWARIKSIRAKSNEIEAVINSTDFEGLKVLNIFTGWPS